MAHYKIENALKKARTSPKNFPGFHKEYRQFIVNFLYYLSKEFSPDPIFASASFLAKEANVTKSSCQTFLNELRKSGYIKVVKSKEHKKCQYFHFIENEKDRVPVPINKRIKGGQIIKKSLPLASQEFQGEMGNDWATMGCPVCGSPDIFSTEIEVKEGGHSEYQQNQIKIHFNGSTSCGHIWTLEFYHHKEEIFFQVCSDGISHMYDLYPELEELDKEYDKISSN